MQCPFCRYGKEVQFLSMVYKRVTFYFKNGIWKGKELDLGAEPPGIVHPWGPQYLLLLFYLLEVLNISTCCYVTDHHRAEPPYNTPLGAMVPPTVVLLC